MVGFLGLDSVILVGPFPRGYSVIFHDECQDDTCAAVVGGQCKTVCIPHSTAKPLSALDPMGPECPHIISKKLMKNFTSLTYNNGR